MPGMYDYDPSPGRGVLRAALIVLLALAVGAALVGSGWLALSPLAPKTEAEGKASPIAQAEDMATPVPTATPTPVPTPTPMALSLADWALPNGHFFTQTNGRPPLTSAMGYAVTNEAGITFWDRFQQLGGTGVVGYPLSGRFVWHGFETQVFQRAIFQWNSTDGAVQVVNILDILSDQSKNQWLLDERATPKPLPAAFDQGKSFAEVAEARLGLLAADPAIQAYYNSLPDPMMLLGLPTSTVTDMDDHYAIRLQRGVLQRWKVDRPWARAGAVTAANSGQLAIEAGVLPPVELRPRMAPQLPR